MFSYVKKKKTPICLFPLWRAAALLCTTGWFPRGELTQDDLSNGSPTETLLSRYPSPRPDPAAPTPSSLTPCCRASAIHISSRIQRGGAGGSGGINKSKPTGSDAMRRNGISHLFFSILLEVESFAQAFIVFCRVSGGSEWRPRISPTSQRATGGKPRLIILVCVSVWLLGVSLWRPRRFSSLPVFHIKLPLQKESSNGRTARTVHASLGCRRADADISKSVFLYIHIYIKKFSITFFFSPLKDINWDSYSCTSLCDQR